jgi:predicted TIM-barrel fold metal-dependent hydrolase
MGRYSSSRERFIYLLLVLFWYLELHDDKSAVVVVVVHCGVARARILLEACHRQYTAEAVYDDWQSSTVIKTEQKQMEESAVAKDSRETSLQVKT